MTMGRGRFLAPLRADRKGAASAEMALVIPILFALMCGGFELSRYFLHEHTVLKAVRDGARYASRRKFTDYSCASANAGAEQAIRNLTRTGTIGGTQPRLSYWTDETTITVSVACDTSGTYKGVYEGLALGAPVVTVSASVPYTSLFGLLGYNTSGLALNAKSESAVMGI